MKNGDCVRQGDVLVVKVKSIPRDAAPAKDDPRGTVLMEGELTGHYHGFDTKSGVELLERPSGERFLSVPAGDPKPLRHDEHTSIFFEEGKFQIGHQVEDFGEEVRRVAD